MNYFLFTIMVMVFLFWSVYIQSNDISYSTNVHTHTCTRRVNAKKENDNDKNLKRTYYVYTCTYKVYFHKQFVLLPKFVLGILYSVQTTLDLIYVLKTSVPISPIPYLSPPVF